MTTQTQKMLNILSALAYALIEVKAIENSTGDFFVIYYGGGSIHTTNAITPALKSVEGLSICLGESGYSVAKGDYLTVNY